MFIMRLVIGWLSFSLLLAEGGGQFYPGSSYDPSIPTLKQVVGHDWGQEITDHAQMERYIAALDKASPQIQTVRFGETWEGRSLYYLMVGSPKNLSRVESIKRGMQRIAAVDGLDAGKGQELIRSLPCVVWLAYGVHGSEISSPEAALLAAYHLAAARGDKLVEEILSEALIIIDPLQNPDGRERFIGHSRRTRARWPDENQLAAEHNEDWPGGRSNHYLFDMNRDWFALTQRETNARVGAFLEWFPLVFVDFHEMGADSTYYFAPPAAPINPELSPAQSNWHSVFGKNNAAWFDKMNFDYFTREVFDSFYPGYGEGWPMFHGAIGMTYEQASSRGLVVKRKDETRLTLRDAVQHHFIASLATAQTAARNREGLLRHFLEYRQLGKVQGAKGPVKGYLLDPTGDPSRVRKLVRVLMRQGIRVERAQGVISVKAKDYLGANAKTHEFPAGAYFVPLAQPAKALVSTLLARETPMDSDFIKEQLRRYEKRLGNEIYDITGWSLPLLYDVDCYVLEEDVPQGLIPLTQEPSEGGSIQGGRASLAYLIPWGSNSAIRALSRLLRAGIRVYSSDKAFVQQGVSYGPGTLIIKVKDNPSDLFDKMSEIGRAVGTQIHSTNTAWVDSGVNFGSGSVRYVKKPKVAMAFNRPVSSSSVGALWFLMEREYEYPVTLVQAYQLGSADLREFDVLILPDAYPLSGGYQGVLGEDGVRRIKEWISSGGTLVTIGEATRWLTEEKVALLATSREFRRTGRETSPDRTRAQEAGEEKRGAEPRSEEREPFDLEKTILPEKELPGAIPGAILRVRLDPEHWLAFGYDAETNVLATSRNIFTPLKLDKGRNVAVYMPADKLLISGFSWEDTKDQLAGKAYLMHQAHGRGQVVAFAEDPNFRAFCDGLNRLLLNAVLLGPAH